MVRVTRSNVSEAQSDDPTPMFAAVSTTHSAAAPASSLLYIPKITTAVSPTALFAFNWHCVSNLRSLLDREVALMGREKAGKTRLRYNNV